MDVDQTQSPHRLVLARRHYGSFHQLKITHSGRRPRGVVSQKTAPDVSVEEGSQMWYDPRYRTFSMRRKSGLRVDLLPHDDKLYLAVPHVSDAEEVIAMVAHLCGFRVLWGDDHPGGGRIATFVRRDP